MHQSFLKNTQQLEPESSCIKDQADSGAEETHERVDNEAQIDPEESAVKEVELKTEERDETISKEAGEENTGIEDHAAKETETEVDCQHLCVT